MTEKENSLLKKFKTSLILLNKDFKYYLYLFE